MESYLGKEIPIVVDYPLGFEEQEKKLYYPLNYGHAACCIEGENRSVGVYVLGVHKPINEYMGTVIAVIKGNEEQLVVASEALQYSKEQILALIEFREKRTKSEIMVASDYLGIGDSAEQDKMEMLIICMVALIELVIAWIRHEQTYALLLIIVAPWIVSSYYCWKNKRSKASVAQLVFSVFATIYWGCYYIGSLF